MLGVLRGVSYALMVVSLSLVVVACQSVDKGELALMSAEQALRSGDVPMAIRYYQQAVAQSPDQPVYQQRLDTLVTSYIDSIKSDAAKNAKLRQVPAFDKALASVNNAHQLLPEQSALNALLEDLTASRDQLLASVERSYDACLENIEKGDWIAALREARFVTASYPSFRRIDQLNMTIATEGYRYYLDRAGEAFRSQRYTEARQFAKNSLLLNAEGSMVAKQIISDSLRLLSDEPVEQQITGYLLTGDADQAVELCDQNPQLQTSTDCQLATQQQISQQATGLMMQGHKALDANNPFAALKAANELVAFKARNLTVTWSQTSLIKHDLLIERVIAAVQQQVDILATNQYYALAWYWLRQLEPLRLAPVQSLPQMRAQALRAIKPTIFMAPFVNLADNDFLALRQLHQVLERHVEAAYNEQVTMVAMPVAKELLTSIGENQPILGIAEQWSDLLQSLNVTHVLSGRVGLNRADEVVTRQASTAIDEQGNEYPVDKTFVKRVAFLELDLQLTDAVSNKLMVAKQYRERSSQQDSYHLDSAAGDGSAPLLEMASLDELSAQLLSKVSSDFTRVLITELPPPLVSAYQRTSLHDDSTTTMKAANDWASVLLLELKQTPIDESKTARAEQQISSLLASHQW